MPSNQFIGKEIYLRQSALADNDDAITYIVRHAQTQEKLILKELHVGHLHDWKSLELLEREARVLAHLNHPQIPALRDYFSQDTETGLAYYLVTNLIEGENLAQKYAGDWWPKESDCIQIAHQILNILAYLQSFSPPIIHRDIKPSNLLMDPEGQIHLIDFGSVQELLHPESASGSTTVGTLGYMAPEQFVGKAEPASDLYGLGTTLVHLLTGRNPGDLSRRDGRLQYRGFTECSLPFLEWLDFLICLEASDRFSSAEEALQQLHHIMPAELQEMRQEIVYPTPQDRDLEQLLKQPDQNHQYFKTPQKRSLEPGDLLERSFRIKAVLGRGTRTAVYAAQNTQTDQSVIIKELNLSRISNWKELELFQREAETLSQMRHPRIPRLLDWIEKREEKSLILYLISEHIEGQTLSEKLAQGWRPSQAEVWKIARQLLSILIYLQDCQPAIFHRDIKPSNILMDSQGEIWLIDFGAVQNRFRKQNGGSTVIGSVGYMAPEQFSGRATEQSDLYGLAASLIKLLSGREPADLPFKDHQMIFEDCIQCPSGMMFWLKKMLAPEPQERYRSAREALQALDHCFKKPVAETQTRVLRGRSQEILPRFKPGTLPQEIMETLLDGTPLSAAAAIGTDEHYIPLPTVNRQARRRNHWPRVIDIGLTGSFITLMIKTHYFFMLQEPLHFIVSTFILASIIFGLGFFRGWLIHALRPYLFPLDLNTKYQTLFMNAQGLFISPELPYSKVPLADNIYYRNSAQPFKKYQHVRWQEIKRINVIAQSEKYNQLSKLDASEGLHRISIKLKNAPKLSLTIPLEKHLAPRLELCLQEIQKFWQVSKSVEPKKDLAQVVAVISAISTPVVLGLCTSTLIWGAELAVKPPVSFSPQTQTQPEQNLRATHTKAQPKAKALLPHAPRHLDTQYLKQQIPAYQPPVYQPPAYQPPIYQPPQQPRPNYQAPAYQPPTYRAPTYQAPQQHLPNYNPPAYQPPTYRVPTYQAPQQPLPNYPPPAYRPPNPGH